MIPFEGGLFALVMLISWIVPIALAIWLILSIIEIKSLLKDIRDELRAGHR